MKDERERAAVIGGVLRLLAGAFPLSSTKMSEPDVAVVWLELFADHDAETLTEAARRVCFNEQFPSVAALHRHYQAAWQERNDERQRLSPGEDQEDFDSQTFAEGLAALREATGHHPLSISEDGDTHDTTNIDDDDDCGGRDPYADLGYEKR